MKGIRTILFGAAGTLLVSGSLLAQHPAKKPHPKIREAQARATALARVPHARVRSKELEYEGGRWIYSYDLKVPGKAGIQEVNVDAMTGKVVAVEHENARAEAKEAAREGEARH